MPIATQEHSQLFCRHCKKHTLHLSEKARPSHGLHLLVTLFVWPWVAVWLILCYSAKIVGWHCSQCGQKYGTQTPEEVAATRARDHQYFQEKAKQKTQRRQEAATRKRLVREERRAAISRFREGAALSGKSFLRRIDTFLQRTAGDDEFMHWFFRIAIVAVPLMTVFIIIAVIWG